ncbi:MAG: hypothetical protein QM802_22200 [Agriterribacter sp.]
MKKIQWLSVLNLLALIIQITLSYGTQLHWLSAKDVGQVSDQYHSLFTPSGITFAIWGIIYLALLISCIYHMVMAFRHNQQVSANKDIEKIGGWFILNNLGAAAWLLVWTNEMIGFSLVLIFFQLLTLIVIHANVGIYHPARSWADAVFTQFPLSIYIAWISIASIANTAIYLVSINWTAFGISAIMWTVIMIAVAVLLTMLMVTARRNAFYGLVVMWALYGIFIKLRDEDAQQYTMIINAALAGIGITGIVTLMQFISNAKWSSKIRLHPGSATFPVAHHSLK